MKCRFCGARSGWRRRCADCRVLWKTWLANRGQGMRRLLASFEELPIERNQIERFLEAEPKPGGGTIRDHIAAEMANQLLGALGQGASQDPEKTKKLREVGAWKGYDQRPEE